jgi:hypothetical protein
MLPEWLLLVVTVMTFGSCLSNCIQANSINELRARQEKSEKSDREMRDNRAHEAGVVPYNM